LIDLDQIPKPSERRIAMRVKPAAERALRKGHPWLFEEAIRYQSHSGRPGDLAVIFDRKNRFLAIGLYDPDNPIHVRILQHNRPATIDREWFYNRLAKAQAIRANFPSPVTDAYRLVHGENDGLPGLIIDRYASNFVLKLYTAAWYPYLPDVIAALNLLLPSRRIVLRLSRNLPGRMIEAVDGQVLVGPPLDSQVRFLENGLTFSADLLHGQKTGFFLDQRENRARVEALVLASKKGGNRACRQVNQVLNLFAYSGGFSLYSARGGAGELLDVDASQPALAMAEQHFSLNRSNPAIARAIHETYCGDAFKVTKQFDAQNRRFDLIVVDPPSFAKRGDETGRALNAYRRLVRDALSLLRPKGALIMASCSSRVSTEEFFATLHQEARTCGRPLRELDRTGHPLDHPIGFPQGAYLKCLFSVVP
jgi:23S rRNA (cytosine1962-C5)-methyltransferase